METIAGEYGMVVITRNGSEPEKFVNDSKLLSKCKVNTFTSIVLLFSLSKVGSQANQSL